MRLRNSFFCTVLIASLLGSPSGFAADQPDPDEELFAIKILPLLKQKCFQCHGAGADLKGGYDLTTRDGLLKGGESGDPSIVVGNPAESLFVSAIKWEGYEMPPKENDRLTAQQIKWIEAWIVAGAPWPNDETIAAYRQKAWGERVTDEGILIDTSGGLNDEWTYRRYQVEDVWAFEPVVKHEVPKGSHPIDYFIRKSLHESDFELAPIAEPKSLLRRAYYDLTGLPPTPFETSEFVKAWREDREQAWDSLIDKLLASPHYGERWGQHWLDVVRYADSGGYSNDYERSNAWRYRDYVVRAFNEDKPYNQFVIEQLAGDELADRSVSKRVPEDNGVAAARKSGAYNEQEAEWLVATSFLRMGPFDNAMVLAPQARQIYLDDVVNSVGQTFLSTTMRCVKCHDHKFDPIPTRDYYRFYAAFAATQMAERPVAFLPQENQVNFESEKAHVATMLSNAEQQRNIVYHKQETAAKTWFAERGLEYKDEGARQKLPDDQKPPRHVGLNATDKGRYKVYKQDVWIWTSRQERFQPLIQGVYNGMDDPFRFPGSRKLRIIEKQDPKWQPETFILMGGALEAQGDSVQPGVLSGLGLPGSPTGSDSYLLPNTLNGRRWALAKWIADEKNALTTRSIVNRIWQYHFGQGIARNPNNFGGKGAKPTHPKLLDYLAADFVENGWVMKRLHKLIMSSATYRQSTQRPDLEKLEEVDPNNEMWGVFQPRRLTAEEIRDSFLAMTGELNPEMGGLPIRPEINMEVALQPRMIQFSLAPAYQPSPEPDMRNRRTIYAYRVRGQPDPFLELFNQPNPNDSCELRDSLTVTPQALTLLNSDIVTDRSIALAQRLIEERETLEQQIRRAFWLAYGRDPVKLEMTRLKKYVNDMRAYHRQVTPAVVNYPTEITRSLVEEFSGQPFEYLEKLPVFKDYNADTKARDVDAEARALADLCLLIFNSSEFLYVY
ncbi:MAG: PSD1 and planctomycete cytochrome C domain-containing protein [Planctomycetota bacterium]|nr:PSD1 and planctomycete cytochrome C domain-containing protein [Planctomycetota bacterium]